MKYLKLRSNYIFAVAFVVFSLFLLTTTVSADTRTSQLKGGWQIWIDAGTTPTNRDGNDAIKLGVEEPLAADFLAGTATAQRDGSTIGGPALGDDVVIAVAVGGFIEYEFESPIAGDAFVYARISDFRGGGQSWFLVLNSKDHEGQGVIIDTPRNWGWATGRDNKTKFPQPLVAGKNVVRIVPREAEPQREILIDIIMISSVEFQPTDDDFNNASPLGGPTAVQPEGKLTTTWAAIKRNF
jgi:hypothetical protein